MAPLQNSINGQTKTIELPDTINECWNNGTLHKNEANLATIYKKGNPELPQYYRPIALFNIAYKLLAVIILKRELSPT